MSAKKVIHEFRTILNFNEKVKKNTIRQAIRKAEILYYNNGTSGLTFIENEIIIGIYKITLHLHNDQQSKIKNRLKDYGKFGISIDYNKSSIINSDNLYLEKSLIKKNETHCLNIKDLIDIIYYYNRLNQLKCFL